MIPLPSLLDPEALIARAKALWSAARDAVGGERFDLFLKTAARTRVRREREADGMSISETLESGLAVRIVRPREAMASFATCTGVTDEALRRALAVASRDDAGCSPEMPAPGTVEEAVRIDVEPPRCLPDPAEVESWAAGRPDVAWIECGIALEAVVGSEGWIAIRGRRRTWAMTDEGGPRLFARRGFAAPDFTEWPGSAKAIESSKRGNRSTLIFAPAAASTIVSALVRAIHGGSGQTGLGVGAGWCVADEPEHPMGLAGGKFDDAGFPTKRTLLADGATAVDVLNGPGTLRRLSFRDAPAPSASAVVVFPDAPIPSTDIPAITRCRVLPVSADEWVIELKSGLGPGRPAFARVSPESLVAGCRGTAGESVGCADGVITPGLVFEGIRLVQ